MRKIILLISIVFLFFSCENSYNEPLRNAIRDKNITLVKKLINQGANVNTIEKKSGDTAFFLAAEFGDLKFMKFLIQNGVDFKQRNGMKATPLMVACFYKQFDIVEFLISCGSEVNSRDFSGNTPLMWAVRIEDNLEIVKLLITNNADVNAIAESGSVIWNAVTENQPSLVELLIENNASIDFRTESGWSLLAWATENKYNKIVQILKKYGAKE